MDGFLFGLFIACNSQDDNSSVGGGVGVGVVLLDVVDDIDARLLLLPECFDNDSNLRIDWTSLSSMK